MKKSTVKKMIRLVDFEKDVNGELYVKNVNSSVFGNVVGSVGGSVKGNICGSVIGSVWGTINKRKWQYVETPKERTIRLIRQGEIEEAIRVLEESE